MSWMTRVLGRTQFVAAQGWRLADVWLSRHLDRAPRTLPILILMVTDRCNLKCRMCGACSYEPGDHGELTTDEWKTVIDSAAKLQTSLISITGGEALLRRDLFEIIRHAHNLGIAVHLNSNGTLLVDRVVDRLGAAGLDTLSVSLDSHDAKTHDSIRGEGSFEQTITGLRRVRQRTPRVKLGINMVVNAKNYRNLDRIVPLADDLGVDQLKLAPIHANLQHRDKPLDEYADMIFTPKELDSLDAEVGKVRQAIAESGLQTTSDHFFDGFRRLYEEPNANFYCYAGYATCVVDHQGWVAACFDKDGAANVRQHPLHEIWRSPGFQAHRALVRNCKTSCWESTNAELSHRFSVRGMFGDLRQSWRDLRFYFGNRSDRRSSTTQVDESTMGSTLASRIEDKGSLPRTLPTAAGKVISLPIVRPGSAASGGGR